MPNLQFRSKMIGPYILCFALFELVLAILFDFFIVLFKIPTLRQTIPRLFINASMIYSPSPFFLNIYMVIQIKEIISDSGHNMIRGVRKRVQGAKPACRQTGGQDM